MQLNSGLEKDLGQCRIIIIGLGIAGQECMNAKMLHAFGFQVLEALCQLFTGKAVFCLPWYIHDSCADLEITACIETTAYCLRKFAHILFEIFQMGDIIKINNDPHILGIGIFIGRCYIR